MKISYFQLFSERFTSVFALKTYRAIGCCFFAQPKSNSIPKSCKIYKNARPLDQLVVKSFTFNWYLSVNCRTHRSRLFSKPLTVSELTSFWPSKHKAIIEIKPSVNFGLPPTISSLEMLSSLTPFSLSTCSTLLTLLMWCTRMRPFSRFYTANKGNQMNFNQIVTPKSIF